MKRLFFLLAVALALGPPALAQQTSGSITNAECVTVSVTNQSTVGIQVTGTWTGTLQPKISIQGQTPQNIQVTPSTSSSAQSTITGNGVFKASVAGGTVFQVCGATVASGTATVFLNSSQGVSVSNSGGIAGSVPFSGITSATNSSATMHVGTGASLDATGSGTITATAVPWSGVSAGSNTNALTMGTGGSIKPLNLGQLAGSQGWLAPGITVPSTTGTLAGGTIGAGQVWQIQYTLNTALGETLPSILLSGSTTTLTGGTCSGGAVCTLTITAPTLGSYSSWTAYACNTSVGPCTVPQKLASCTAITGNCVLTAPTGSNTSGVPTTNTAIIQPANIQAFNGPAGAVPSLFFPKADGNYYPWVSVDWNSCDGTTGPPTPCGTPLFTHRTFFSNTQGSTQPLKNSFVSIASTTGVQTVSAGNQERALSVSLANPTGDSSTHYAMEGAQMELDVNGTPTCCSSPDGELSTLSLQFSDQTTSPTSIVNGYGANVLRAQYFGGNTAGGQIRGFVNGIQSIMTNNSTVAYSAGSIWNNYYAKWTNNNTATNLFGFGYTCQMPTTATKFSAGNACFYIPNQSLTLGNIDMALMSEWQTSPGPTWALDGPLVLDSLSHDQVGAMAVNASTNVVGSVTSSQISLGTSGISSATCSGGASTYTWQLVFVDNNGGQSPAGTTSNAVNTCTNPLSVGNPATINIAPGLQRNDSASTTHAFQQAARIDVYRVSGPMATGKIGSLTCAFNTAIYGCTAFSDTGLAATGTIPTANTSGQTASVGYLAAQANKVFVASNFTTAANTNLQTITGLSWNLDGNAKNYNFHCSLSYSQGTANAAVAFGIQAATVNPTNIFANGTIQTNTTAYSGGTLATLATTTATAIVSATPGATATNFTATLDGTIEEPANNQGQVINIMTSTATAADAVTVLRGSYCYLY